MTVNSKNIVLGTKKETNTSLEQKQSYIKDKKSLAIKKSLKLYILNVKRNIFQKQVDIYLQKLNRRYCIKFADYFEDIPYTHKLLTDIYHYIKLKNSSQTFII